MTRLSELNTELDRLAPALARSTDVQAQVTEGRRLRTVMLSGMARRAVQSVGRSENGTDFSRAIDAFAQWAPVRAWKRRRTITELQKLSDRMLADIGLNRGQIVQVATVLAAAPGSPVRRQAKPAREPLFARLRRARQRRQAIQELEQLPDRILADIGISRGEIPATVDKILEKRRAPAAAGKTSHSPVHELISHLEGAVRPLRQWHLSRLAAGQIARLGNTTLSDLGYVKGDVDWVPEVMAERKIANSATPPQAGAA